MLNYTDVTGIFKDSRQVIPGSVYFCFEGEKSDGHDYIDMAFDLGASFIVGTKDLDIDNYYKVSDINLEMAKAAKIVYNFDLVNMKFIAVTGTDGKTSVTTLTNKILNSLSTSSYLGTSGLVVKNVAHGYNGMTTPFANDLYKYIEIANKETDNFIMEISSHAFAQKRVSGLKLDVAGFTNLSHDHLDFHDTFEDYYKAKCEILDYIKEDGYFVSNIDNEYGLSLFNQCESKKYSYGKDKRADFIISDINLSLRGTSFVLTHQGISYNINTILLAEFNVYNLVHAIISAYCLGFELDKIIEVCTDINVEGRVELFRYENNADFILDFAHTPDSILKVMKYIHDNTNDKIICIGGSAGGRDSLKRSDMGLAMAKYSDLVIITEDDPRSESVISISNDIAKNIEEGKYIIIENRLDAIRHALLNTSKNDIIVMLGKAGQTLMYYDGYTSKYVEEDAVSKIVKEYNEGY